MSPAELLILILVFLFTSVIGVVTGSNSLIAVPVMFQVGMDEKVAVATNMFALVFMAIGGAIPFIRQRSVDLKSLSPLIMLTMAGSAIGAAIVGVISNHAIKLIVTAAMFAIVIFTLFHRKPSSENAAATPAETKRGAARTIGFILTFILAIYGGLFSGGYVTVLTASFVAFFAMPYSGSIAATKVVNVFSSLVATLVFLYQGLVDIKLGLILGAAMFVGAYIGAHFATKLNEAWLRRIFLSAVALLAIKSVFDLFR